MKISLHTLAFSLFVGYVVADSSYSTSTDATCTTKYGTNAVIPLGTSTARTTYRTYKSVVTSTVIPVVTKTPPAIITRTTTISVITSTTTVPTRTITGSITGTTVVQTSTDVESATSTDVETTIFQVIGTATVTMVTSSISALGLPLRHRRGLRPKSFATTVTCSEHVVYYTTSTVYRTAPASTTVLKPSTSTIVTTVYSIATSDVVPYQSVTSTFSPTVTTTKILTTTFTTTTTTTSTVSSTTTVTYTPPPIIINGDFETGDFTGFQTYTYGTGATLNITSPGAEFSSFAIQSTAGYTQPIEPYNTGAYIYQALNTAPNTTYVLSFDYYFTQSNSDSSISIHMSGQTLNDQFVISGDTLTGLTYVPSDQYQFTTDSQELGTAQFVMYFFTDIGQQEFFVDQIKVVPA